MERRGIVDHEVVAIAVDREEAVDRLRQQRLLARRLPRHPVEPRLELSFQFHPFVAVRVARAPRQPVEFPFRQMLQHDLQRHLADHFGAPEGRRRDIRRGRDAAGAVVMPRALDRRRFVQFLIGFGAILLDEDRPLLLIDQGVDHFQALESVLAVEHTRRIGLVAVLQEQDAPPELPVDRRPADQHRKCQIPPCQLVNNQRHLLGLVLTSSALKPMASALYSTAFSMMVFAGTCLPRS